MSEFTLTPTPSEVPADESAFFTRALELHLRRARHPTRTELSKMTHEKALEAPLAGRICPCPCPY